MKRSKSYRAAADKIDKDELYSPLQAVRLAKETTVTKFDPTIEVKEPPARPATPATAGSATRRRSP